MHLPLAYRFRVVKLGRRDLKIELNYELNSLALQYMQQNYIVYFDNTLFKSRLRTCSSSVIKNQGSKNSQTYTFLTLEAFLSSN